MTQTPEAFEALYTQHYWALLRYAVRRLPDEESARDLVADTFTVAWRRRHRIPPDRALPWLYRVAGNLLANRRRSTARAFEVTRLLGTYAGSPVAAEPAERAEWSEELAAVLAVVRTLGSRDREVLLLHAWEGLHGADLGAALGCSAGAAAARLHRARRRLRAAQAAAGAEAGKGPPARASEPTRRQTRQSGATT